MSNPDDTDRTPAATPAAKRSSGELRLLLTECPKCEGSGVMADNRPIRNSPDDEPCSLCNGGQKVAHSIAVDYILTHSSAPPPPDTERP